MLFIVLTFLKSSNEKNADNEKNEKENKLYWI